MKIGVAQTRPVSGDIARNISDHLNFANVAVLHGADVIIFPELSLTGYEPQLASALAIHPGDSRLDVFQHMSDSRQVIIGVGVPTTGDSNPHISMILFQPQQPRQAYSKQYLHQDETPYFVPGNHQVFLSAHRHTIAPAICYELSIPQHPEYAFRLGADIYLVSVAKTAAGMENAARDLSHTARTYGMTVLVANCTGMSDGEECGGASAAWNNQGVLMAQMASSTIGVLCFDTQTQEVSQWPITLPL